MRTGYHYTSYSNWKEIRKHGFTPYFIQKPDLDQYFPDGVSGVWIWKNNPKGLSHCGTLIFQASYKAETHIVKLKIRYNPKDILRFERHPIEMHHKGIAQNLIYHTDEIAIIIPHHIPPKDIQLVKEFNLIKLLA